MAKCSAQSVVLTTRISPTLSKKLDNYAKIAGYTKSRAVERLLQYHIDYDTWFVREVQKDIESGESWIPHEEVFCKLREKSAARRKLLWKKAV